MNSVSVLGMLIAVGLVHGQSPKPFQQPVFKRPMEWIVPHVIKPSCVCSNNNAEVCGTDGITYGNAFCFRQCSGPGAKIAYRYPCQTNSEDDKVLKLSEVEFF